MDKGNTRWLASKMRKEAQSKRGLAKRLRDEADDLDKTADWIDGVPRGLFRRIVKVIKFTR